MEGVVKQVLASVQADLYDYLPLDVDFIIRLQNEHLINNRAATKLRPLARNGDQSCIQELIDYMRTFFDEATLNKFCTFLDKYGQDGRPVMVKLAAKISVELKALGAPPTQATLLPTPQTQATLLLQATPQTQATLLLQATPQTTHSAQPSLHQHQEVRDKRDFRGQIKSVSDLLPFLNSMLPHLEQLGPALGNANSARAIINGPGLNLSKCQDILQNWLDCTPAATWDLLCEKLISSKVPSFTHLIAEIQEAQQSDSEGSHSMDRAVASDPEGPKYFDSRKFMKKYPGFPKKVKAQSIALKLKIEEAIGNKLYHKIKDTYEADAGTLLYDELLITGTPDQIKKVCRAMRDEAGNPQMNQLGADMLYDPDLDCPHPPHGGPPSTALGAPPTQPTLLPQATPQTTHPPQPSLHQHREVRDKRDFRAHEEMLTETCWIPFGLQTHNVIPSDSTVVLYLVPGTEDCLENAIRLEVPGGVVKGPSLEIRTAVIACGPMFLPDTLLLASMVVYVDFKPESVSNSLILHLPDWRRKDGTTRSRRTVIRAVHDYDHSLKGYQFKVLPSPSGKQPESDSIYLGPHCCLYAAALEQDDLSSYYLTAYESREETTTTVQVVVTYKSPTWIAIIEKDYFYKIDNCKRIDQPRPFDFQQGQNEPFLKVSWQEQGSGELDWSVVIPGRDKIYRKDVKLEQTSPKDLELSVKCGIYSPAIKCEINFMTDPRYEREFHSVPLAVSGDIEGTKPVVFKCFTRQRKAKTQPINTSPQPAPAKQSEPILPAIIQGIHTQPGNYIGDSPGFSLLPQHQPTAPVIVPRPAAPAADPILNSTPILSDVLLHLRPRLSAQWKDFSICLQFQHNQREIIAEDNHYKSDNCFMAVINQWLRKRSGTGDLPRTWRTLLKVVCDLEHSDIADEVHRALAAASTGVPLSQPTPPLQPRPLQQQEEQEKEKEGEIEAEHRPGDEQDGRGVVKFALITANDNEWESAKFFMGAPMENCKISDFLRMYLPGHLNFSELFQTDDTSAELTGEYFKTYCFVRVCGVLGVLTKCTKMGSHRDGASGDTVVELFKTAREEKWELKAVFLVGCCGCASAPKENVNLGAVLIADPILLYEGKVTKEGLDRHSNACYRTDQSWVRAFTLGNSMPRIAEKLKVQNLKSDVPFLSGDFLIKWGEVAEILRERYPVLGFEMEGAGVNNVVKIMSLLEWFPSDQKPPAILVVKGVCDSANSEKNECADTAFFKETIPNADKDSRQQMCTMMSLMVVFRGIKVEMAD